MQHLLHPAVLGAMIVTFANDRWLKFASLLPAVITGKVSDFCGLFFAPFVLFAFGEKWVGSSRLWFVTSAFLVGLGFTLLQLSSFFVEAYVWFHATMGLQVRVTQDPSDLWALLSLPCAYVLFKRRLAVTAALGLFVAPVPSWGNHAEVHMGFYNATQAYPEFSELSPGETLPAYVFDVRYGLRKTPFPLGEHGLVEPFAGYFVYQGGKKFTYQDRSLEYRLFAHGLKSGLRVLTKPYARFSGYCEINVMLALAHSFSIKSVHGTLSPEQTALHFAGALGVSYQINERFGSMVSYSFMGALLLGGRYQI